MTPTPEDIIRIARQFLFVREAQAAGQNRGLRVEAIQRWCGGQPGDSWCAQFATMVLDIAYQGNAPLAREGSCEAIYNSAGNNRWIRNSDAARPGMLYLYVNAQGRAHHVGIVTLINPLIGIAGNTSEDGSSSNGDRVAEHAISAHVFVDYMGTVPV